MVLKARPQVQVVALDLFGRSYEQHFGKAETGEQRLQANLRAAGVESRATIQKADMRELPFDTASFDGIVSAYAIDHLNREGIGKALGEGARVLKPRGEFLLMIIGKDPWLRFSFGPLLLHSTRPASWWVERLQEAGFQNIEHGQAPATFYYLAHKM
jgi:ubiquinone/menaquinone biosynthesis C-methylase UbiE